MKLWMPLYLTRLQNQMFDFLISQLLLFHLQCMQVTVIYMHALFFLIHQAPTTDKPVAPELTPDINSVSIYTFIILC
jgi:hypothetical protein